MTNIQIRMALAEGRMVRTRLHGNSMTPKIHSGDLVTIAPWPADRDAVPGDIVFCKVRHSYYLHKVTACRRGIVAGSSRITSVQISNNHGHVNGWTPTKNVFGILVKVEP